jgi:hypothetical protein
MLDLEEEEEMAIVLRMREVADEACLLVAVAVVWLLKWGFRVLSC